MGQIFSTEYAYDQKIKKQFCEQCINRKFTELLPKQKSDLEPTQPVIEKTIKIPVSLNHPKTGLHVMLNSKKDYYLKHCLRCSHGHTFNVIELDKSDMINDNDGILDFTL